MGLRRILLICAILLLLPLTAYLCAPWWHERLQPDRQSAPIAGSEECRGCHADFHALWSTSRHALTLRPVDRMLLAVCTPPPDTAVQGIRLRLEGSPAGELTAEGEGRERYTVPYAVGGKNVLYFLAALPRGRLQTLPLSYDVRRSSWFPTAGSALRHFSAASPDTTLPWTHRAYAFGNSCYRCHVSQSTLLYEPGTDTYSLPWVEPGINCESCHGPARRHVAVFQQARPEAPPSDPAILSLRSFSGEQANALCLSCHAKMSPLTSVYPPGEPFFDHFDLAGLEDEDFTPDGRERGETYTATSWSLSRCVTSGALSCLHCHTSSGRFRFSADPDRSCLPCHEGRVQDGIRHTHHEPGTPGARCIDCHMPQGEFARMRRTDHSMRPPLPAASRAFGSPNACTLCHDTRSDLWAETRVRSWHPDSRRRDASLLEGRLIAKARRRDWSELGPVLGYRERPERREIVAASLFRLLKPCNDGRARGSALRALSDRSPLVRAAAAELLGVFLERVPRDTAARRGLLQAAGDSVRLVRVRAAASLALVPPAGKDPLPGMTTRSAPELPPLPSGPAPQPLLTGQTALERATAEYLAALHARPDDYLSYFNLGNYHAARAEHALALAAFQTAQRLEPACVPALGNAAASASALGRSDEAEQLLHRAIVLEPGEAALHLNLGLLLAQTGRTTDAAQELRTALACDSACAPAAYNLALLLENDRPEEAFRLADLAAGLEPGARYLYAAALFADRSGRTGEAVIRLRRLLRAHPDCAEAYGLLGEILQALGDTRHAALLYRRAARSPSLAPGARREFQEHARRLSIPPFPESRGARLPGKRD